MNFFPDSLNNKAIKVIGLLIDSLGTGGAQRQIVNLAIGLKRLGISPIIIAYNQINFFHDVLEKENIPVVFLKRRHFADFLFIKNLLRLIKNKRIDGLIAMLFMPSGYALISKIFLPKLKVIISERSFEEKTKIWEKIFPRKLYFLADYITVNSITQSNHLKKIFPFYKQKIIFIPNGVHEQKNIYSFSENEIIITSIGRVSSLKNTKILIEAINYVKNNYPNLTVKVYWVGACFDVKKEDSSYFQDCQKMIRAYELESIWEWTGQITSVKNILLQTQLLVHMSYGEGFPNAICEAMSFGIPVVASNVMDHPYIIRNCENGFLAQSIDSAALTKIIVQFLDMSIDERYKISKSAFESAINSFSLDVMSASYFKLIK